jgi:hypothetical protein
MLVGTGGAGCCNSGGAKKRVAKKPAAAKPKAKPVAKRVRKPKAKKGGNSDGEKADPQAKQVEQEQEQEQEQVQKQEQEQAQKEPESTEERQEGGARKKKGSKVVAKRALTPYNKFVKKHFSALKKKFPNDKAPQIMKKIAIEWKKTKK